MFNASEYKRHAFNTNQKYVTRGKSGSILSQAFDKIIKKPRFALHDEEE